MEKIIDAIAEMVTDKVLEKLLDGERMKNFMLQNAPQIHVADIPDFEVEVEKMVDSAISQIDIDDKVDDAVHSSLKNASFSVTYDG